MKSVPATTTVDHGAGHTQHEGIYAAGGTAHDPANKV